MDIDHFNFTNILLKLVLELYIKQIDYLTNSHNTLLRVNVTYMWSRLLIINVDNFD